MLPDTLEGPEIDHDVDERIVIDNGLPIAQFGALDPQVDGLRIDPFRGGALSIHVFVRGTLPVKLSTDPGADTGGDGGGTVG